MFETPIYWENLRSITSDNLTGGWDAVGTPLDNPSFIYKMVNTSDVDVEVSFDGTNAKDVLPAGSFFLYDERYNLAKNTQAYVMGTADSGSGTIYVVSQYRRA